MRVLFLIRSLATGGAERQLVTLVNALDPVRFQISVVTFYSGGQFSSAIGASDRLRSVSLKKRGRWDIFGFFYRLVRLVLSIRPHVMVGMIGGQLPVLAIAWIVRARTMWSIRNANGPGNYDYIRRLLFYLERRFSRLVDAIVYNSRAGCSEYTRRGFRAKKSLVISNGFDVLRFSGLEKGRSAMRSRWGIPEDASVVGCVGRLDPVKGHPSLIQAIASVVRHRPDVRLVCVGDGPAAYRDVLLDLCSSAGVDNNVLWAGPCSDMPLAYGGMDFLVSASLSEGLPNAIGEAMACGVPCIATNVGDCATLIGDTGIVVPAGDVQALSRAILRMLALGPEQRILLGARARQRIIDEYSIAEMVSKTEALLLSLSGKDQWSEHNSLFS